MVKDGMTEAHRNILAFKSSLDKDLEELKRRSEQYSGIIGEKLRANDTSSESDLADLREKISGPVDPKKKKSIKKKDQKGNWHELDGVSIYDGIGLRGELEIYFKALEDVKSRIEKLQKTRESIEGLVSRGVKKDLACTVFFDRELSLDLAFTKASTVPTKFAYRSNFKVDAEKIEEIIA